MKKTFHYILKIIIAGCIAFALCSLFAFFYYNVPVHYDNPQGTTEYVWEKNRFYSKGTEGFAWGRTNNEGFNNLKDYREGESIEILLMGSSNMEAFNVAQDESSAAVINRLFDGEKYCYNIGTAGHDFMYCVKNLGNALDNYRPGEYVVIESFGVDFTADELESVLSGGPADIPSHNGGIVGLLQKLPYLRHIYTQFFKNSALAFGNEGTQSVSSAESFDYESALSPVLDIVAEESRSHGITPIIVHNSSLLIAEDGSGYYNYDLEKLDIFSRLCDEKGIVFIDLCQRFMAEYEENHTLPYGFSNTSPGGGHINKEGHRFFAEEVFSVIKEREG